MASRLSLSASACGQLEPVPEPLPTATPSVQTEPVQEPPPTPPASVQVERLEALLTEYESWRPRTPAPVAASAEIFLLCRLPTLPESEFVASEHGSLLLLDWLNSGARVGFESLAGGAFAPGSAIVKEKLAYAEGDAEPELVALGVMRKRELGFAPEQGDWEFGYWEEGAGLLEGPAASAYCAECHASSPTDFVFLDDRWRSFP